MNKTLYRCVFIVSLGVYFVISVSAPWALNDDNEFLKEFINHELLNLLGVILAITLASAANLHLEFNKIEDGLDGIELTKTRTAVKANIYRLIFSFCLAIFIVLIKSLVPQTEIWLALVNGAGVLVVIFNVLILIDLTQLAFKIKSVKNLKAKHRKAQQSIVFMGLEDE